MGLIDRNYMRTDYSGRPRAGWFSRLRFTWWLVWKRIRNLLRG
jgi:hypothetical protein